MHAALLYVFDGVADPDRLPSDLSGDLPAADISGTAYLDGRTIYDGTLAGWFPEEYPVPQVTEEGITEGSKETERKVAADIYADLEAGWAGVDSSDGERLLADYLATHTTVRPEPAVLDLATLAEELPDGADVNGVVYSQSVEEGHARDAAGAEWHDAVRGVPAEGVAALSVSYTWGGLLVDAMLAASGYVACYRDWTVDQFGRWIAGEIDPYLAAEREGDTQTSLSDACVDCGRSSEDLRRRDSGPLCPVCRDKRDEEGVAP